MDWIQCTTMISKGPYTPILSLVFSKTPRTGAIKPPCSRFDYIPIGYLERTYVRYLGACVL